MCGHHTTSLVSEIVRLDPTLCLDEAFQCPALLVHEDGGDGDLDEGSYPFPC